MKIDKGNYDKLNNQYEKMREQFKHIGENLAFSTQRQVSDMIKPFQDNLNMQMRAIGENSAFNTQRLVTEMMTPLQSKINYIGENLAYSTQRRVTEMMLPFQNSLGKQFKDIGKISVLSTQTLGITQMVTQLQNNWGKQLKDINISMISSLNTSTLDISRMIAKFQNNWDIQLKDVDFSNIKINENGTIGYLNETIDINDVEENINSYFIENTSTEQEVEDNTQYRGKLNAIIIYVFLFILFLCLCPKSYNLPSSVEHQITEYKQNLKENTEHGLDEIAKLFLFIFSIQTKCKVTLDDFAKKSPGQFTIMFNVIIYIIKRIYSVARKKKENIIFSDEIINDRKRSIKLIKTNVKTSIKDEFNSETVDVIYQNNFGIVNHKSLNVKTRNNIKSPIIYKLPFGEIVIIIDTNREWTKIQFTGKDDCNYVGWVSTIHINRQDL